MKVYIAGPMTGLPEHNYPVFNRAARELAQIGFEPLNPVDVGRSCIPECVHGWQWYMRRTLAMLLQADRVALLDGWEGSRGARIEFTLADDLGIPVSPIGFLLYTDEVTP